MGKGFFPFTTNIPFLDSDPSAFSTNFQKDFQPFSSKKAEPVSQLNPAQVDHKDLRYIKEYLTEACHPLPQMMGVKRYTTRTDPREVSVLTTHSQSFCPRPFQPPPASIQQSLVIKRVKQVEKPPESTSHVSIIPHHGSSVIKAKVKHLEEGFPTIEGDGRQHSFVSQYNNTFQGVWSRAAQSVRKHTSSVVMGDPVKIVERETTHTASFKWPTVCSPPVVKERLKLNLGDFSEDLWSSTSRQAFCYHKLGGPVVLTRRNHNASSLPKGDTDVRRNKERMSVTTNKIAFSDRNHTECQGYACRSDLITKSHVQLSSPRLSGLYYITTAKEHYSKQDGVRARPAIQWPSNILSGREHGPSLSITKTDYPPQPLKTCRQTPCLPHQRSNTGFPLINQHFSTTYSEDYTAKPLILQRPGCSQFFTHFAMH